MTKQEIYKIAIENAKKELKWAEQNLKEVDIELESWAIYDKYSRLKTLMEGAEQKERSLHRKDDE